MHGKYVRILVVDDDVACRELVTCVLRDAGYVVEAFADPVIALQHMAAAAPDLLVLDYAMPKLSGREVLQTLPRLGLARLPVVVLSASPHAEASLKEGAARWIEKPFLLPELLDAVARCLAAPVTRANCA
jgi:CheY-like chemotaxis protein